MACSTSGFPVHHQLLGLIQTHVHQVSNVIQPSHSLSTPLPPAFNLSQHQGFFPVSQFFTSGGQSIRASASGSVLPMNQFSSVAQSCPTLCDPMNRSMPGLPVHHHLKEFTQTHVHRGRDAIQPSHPLPPAPNPSQHQSLFQ